MQLQRNPCHADKLGEWCTLKGTIEKPEIAEIRQRAVNGPPKAPTNASANPSHPKVKKEKVADYKVVDNVVILD